MFLDELSNQLIRFDKFPLYVKFRLNISAIHLSLTSDFREKLWVGLGLGLGNVDPGPCQNHGDQQCTCMHVYIHIIMICVFRTFDY